MEQVVYISEACLVALMASCLETPHKEMGGFLVGRQGRRLIKGRRAECLILDVAYPVQTCESGRSFWVPANQSAYNRIKDTIASMGFELAGEYHSHIGDVAELSEADKAFIKDEVRALQKAGVTVGSWVELVLNVDQKSYARKHSSGYECRYFNKKIRCTVKGIANAQTGYAITIGAYQYDPTTEEFTEAQAHIP